MLVFCQSSGSAWRLGNLEVPMKVNVLLVSVAILVLVQAAGAEDAVNEGWSLNCEGAGLVVTHKPKVYVGDTPAAIGNNDVVGLMCREPGQIGHLHIVLPQEPKIYGSVGEANLDFKKRNQAAEHKN